MMLSPTCPAVHGCLAGFARNSSEGVVGNQDLVVAAQRLAAMMADPVDPGRPIPSVALDAFPGHNRLPAIPQPDSLAVES